MPRTTQQVAIDLGQQRDLLLIHRTNLHNLRVQAAHHGLHVPLIIVNEVDHTERQVQQLEEKIARLELEAAEIAHTESQIEHERQLVEALMIRRANAEGVTTPRPLALAICLISTIGSIRVDIETYLRDKGWEMPIEEIIMAGINGIEDMARLVVLLQQKKLSIQDRGYTEIHLFIAGPIVAGATVGAIFDNWKPVKLYHRMNNTPSQSYEYWMPLIGT